MRFRGAIFDQDGLLFDTEKIYQAAWIEAAARQGITVGPEFPRKFCGLGEKLIAKIVEREHPELDIPRYCRDAIEIAWSAQLAGTPEPKKGLFEILRFCRGRGIRTAVASSSTLKVVEHNLRAAGVREYFDAVTTGDEVVNSKPAPDIFLLAASKIGVAPGEAVVFEDAASGIKGAAAAGMGAVFIPAQIAPNDEIRAVAAVHPDLASAIAVFEG